MCPNKPRTLEHYFVVGILAGKFNEIVIITKIDHLEIFSELPKEVEFIS